MRNFTKRKITYTYHSSIRISDLKLGFIIFLLAFLSGYSFISKASYTQKKFSSIQEILNLDGCRITQDEDSHIKKGNGSMYAVDISCGEAFKVFSPRNKEFYRVKTVSFDKRIGDYIILKNGDLEYVFGHTKSNLKKGDKVFSGKEIGVTNISGESIGNHLHFELWEYGYNISYKHLLGKPEKYNMDKTYALRKQRSWYLGEKEAMDFIADFEGFRSKPYIDGKGRLSIGYGTKAIGPNDKVTKEEAKKRKMVVVERLMENVYKNHFVKTHNQRKALVSATYNLGINSNITEVKNRKTDKGIKEYFLRFVKSKGKILGGLVKRRTLESSLYIKK